MWLNAVLFFRTLVPIQSAVLVADVKRRAEYVSHADGTGFIHEPRLHRSNQHGSPMWIHEGKASTRQRGYITTAFGESYRSSAEMLCKSIRKFHDDTPFALVTSAAEASNLVANSGGCFDVVVPYEVGSYKVSMLNNERYNVFPMLSLLKVTPFNETIFFDSDMLRTRPVDLWGFMRKHASLLNQSVVVIGKRKDCAWHFGTACKLERRNNMSLPHTKAALMYVRSDFEANLLWRWMEVADVRYNSLGFSRSCENAMCLEIHLSYGFGKMNWTPVELAEQDVLCFNWGTDQAFPPRILGDPGEKEPTDGRNYSHVHMFGRLPSDSEILFRKLSEAAN